MNEAVILAGGKGTRLREVVADMPKSMAPVNGRPFLEYLLDYLITQGISSFILSVGYRRELIINHFGESYCGVPVDYAEEMEPMGTGGGIRLALWKVKGSRAFAMNGDSLFRVDIKQMMEQHLRRQADVTIALRELDDTGRYGRVEMNRDHKIIGFSEKGKTPGEGYINGGVYILEKKFFMEPEFRGRFSIEKDCFEQHYREAGMFGFPSQGYFLDIGIPDDYQKAQHEFKQFEDR